MTADSTGTYRHRSVLPDLPAPAEYLPLLEEIFENGWYSNFGPLVRRLEDRLLRAIGSPEEICVTCCNATAGLSAALLAAGRTGPVLLPAFTFPASLGAVHAAGMQPVIADVDPQTWALKADLLDRALAETGAGVVMLVAPFGIATDWEAELAICRERGAAVVIDNASGLGGPRPSKNRGLEVFEVFSMHATKPFAVGEGGAIFAHRAHEAALRSALSFALTSHTEPRGPFWGFNGKMSEFHAAVGLAQLDRFPNAVRQRQAFATVYRDRMEGCAQLLAPRNVSSSAWQFFPVLLPSAAVAEAFVKSAATAGIEIRRYYRPSLSHWPQTRRFGACPVAEDLADRMCMLPVRGLNAGMEGDELPELVLKVLDRTLVRHGIGAGGRR